MTDTIKILFLGDLVGRPGRRAVRDFLAGAFADKSKDDYDFVIVNVENASHGFGLTEKCYKELSGAGVDCMTSGNHIWDKKEIFHYIQNADKLVRPINYPKGSPGVGTRIFGDIAVVNVLGTNFMGQINPYWDLMKAEIKRLKKIVPVVIIDFHAEATAEKVCFAKWASELGVTAVLGTHTHIQTADARLLNSKTAYITDAGFCGAYDSVIGMEYKTSLERFLTCLPQRYDVASSAVLQIEGVEIIADKKSGEARDIKSFVLFKNYGEV